MKIIITIEATENLQVKINATRESGEGEAEEIIIKNGFRAITGDKVAPHFLKESEI